MNECLPLRSLYPYPTRSTLTEQWAVKCRVCSIPGKWLGNTFLGMKGFVWWIGCLAWRQLILSFLFASWQWHLSLCLQRQNRTLHLFFARMMAQFVKKKSRYGKGSFIVDEGVVFWNLRCICLSLCNPSLSAPANLWSSSTSTNCVTLAVGFHLYALFVVRQHCWWKIPTCGMVQYWYIVPFACYGNRAFQHCLCSGSVRVGAVDLRTKRPRIYCMLHRLSWKSSSIYLLHKKNKATKVS